MILRPISFFCWETQKSILTDEGWLYKFKEGNTRLGLCQENLVMLSVMRNTLEKQANIQHKVFGPCHAIYFCIHCDIEKWGYCDKEIILSHVSLPTKLNSQNV